MGGGKRMNVNDFEMLNRISLIINNESGSNDAAIARYLIAHLRRSNDITVTTISEHVHVTRSAVRRFCNRLGYQSLSDLKASFSQSVFPSDLSHRSPTMRFAEYRAELDVRMIEMFAEVEGKVSDAIIQNLSDEIERRQDIEIMCANNVSSNLVRFQQEMFFAGKIVRIVSSNEIMRTRPLQESLNGSLLIVVSVSGLFAGQIREYLLSRRAKKILVTAFARHETASDYDKVCYLSDRDDGIDRLGVYSKYAITYFFDLLSSSYLSRFPSTSGNPLFGPTANWPSSLRQETEDDAARK